MLCFSGVQLQLEQEEPLAHLEAVAYAEVEPEDRWPEGRAKLGLLYGVSCMVFSHLLAEGNF